MKKVKSEFFFSKITLENAWFLGFIMADATLGFQKEAKILKLYNIDKNLLESIKLKYDLPYKVTTQKNTNNVLYFIRIADVEFIKTLEKLGFQKDKSQLRVPEMDSSCAKLFLKGFLKGKGSYFKETKTPNYGFKVVYRSRLFINDIAILISQYCEVKLATPHCRIATKTESCELKYLNDSCDKIKSYLAS